MEVFPKKEEKKKTQKRAKERKGMEEKRWRGEGEGGKKQNKGEINAFWQSICKSVNKTLST